MIYILTCNGYSIEGACDTPEEAAVLCAWLEVAEDDGYARLASENGRFVADADGPYDLGCGGPPPYDAATATGMYDAW